MNINKKKHLLLKILSEKKTKSKVDGNATLGLNNEDILNSLNINKYQLDIITSELYVTEEIAYYGMYEVKKGLMVKEKGISAYSTEKYLKRNNSEKINKAKDWVTIIIPIVSVVISLLILCKSKSEISDIKQQYILIEKTQDSIGNHLNQMNEYYRKHLHSSDSLTLKKK